VTRQPASVPHLSPVVVDVRVARVDLGGHVEVLRGEHGLLLLHVHAASLDERVGPQLGGGGRHRKHYTDTQISPRGTAILLRRRWGTMPHFGLKVDHRQPTVVDDVLTTWHNDVFIYMMYYIHTPIKLP